MAKIICDKVCNFYSKITNSLENMNQHIIPLFFRLCLGWEFFEAGYNKFTGQNWFAEISFPFPFNLLSANINWHLAMGFELIGGIALFLGLATRFFSFNLIIITIVAMISVHFSDKWHSLSDVLTGYRILDEQNDGLGNYKLPLIFLIMFLPLLSLGSGKISLDYLFKKCYKCKFSKACNKNSV
ncbi:MAG: hypothetical protein RLZZ210_43 [Pseudomonadota bacterium]|jgi:putative oxidoreductase